MPPDNLGRLIGLAVAFNDGRRALRSRRPTLDPACSDGSFWFPLLVGRRVGDLLSARSSTSGWDRARLDLVGDWKDGGPDARAPSWGSKCCDAPTATPVVALVLRRFGGENMAWCGGYKQTSVLIVGINTRCLHCLHHDQMSLSLILVPASYLVLAHHHEMSGRGHPTFTGHNYLFVFATLLT